MESQLSSVGSDADPRMLQTLASEFPQAGNSGSRIIKQAIEFSATTIKSDLLKEIHQLQNEEAQKVDADFYRTWLNKTRERHEKWLARLQ